MRSYNIRFTASGEVADFQLNNGVTFVYGIASDTYGTVGGVSNALDHRITFSVVNAAFVSIPVIESPVDFKQNVGTPVVLSSDWIFVFRAGDAFKYINTIMPANSRVLLSSVFLGVAPTTYQCQVKIFFDSV